jgi:hypothetical protein
MAAVRALIDTVNEMAQAPLRAGSRVWRGRGAGSGRSFGARRAIASAGAVIEPPVPLDSRYAHGNLEPPIDELLRDPLVHLVMRADRLDPTDVRRTLHAEPATVS